MFSLEEILVRLAALFVALPVHEFAHAWVAYRLGDPTAAREGRLTLDPRAHLDPIGALFLLLTGFGWAKPVPVNPYYLRNLKDMAWVALAGPASHFLLIFPLFLLPPQLFIGLGEFGVSLLRWFTIFAALNLALAFFNLLPLPPLDGSRIVEGFWPRIWYRFFEPWLPYAPLVFFLVLFALPWLGFPVLEILISSPVGLAMRAGCMLQGWVYGLSLCDW